MTLTDWRKTLIDAHPDHGGTTEALMDVLASRPRGCQRKGCKRKLLKSQKMFCSLGCSARARSERRHSPGMLRARLRRQSDRIKQMRAELDELRTDVQQLRAERQRG